MNDDILRTLPVRDLEDFAAAARVLWPDIPVVATRPRARICRRCGREVAGDNAKPKRNAKGRYTACRACDNASRDAARARGKEGR